MKKLSLVLCFALMLVLVLAFNVFAATQTNIEDSARFEQNGSNSDLLDLKLVKDNNYYTGSSCGNSGENWVNYRFYYDEGTIVSKVFVVLNSTGTLSNGKVYETVSTNGYEFYVRLYDKFGNAIFNTKYHSINNATEVKDGNENVLYTYFEIEFDEPYSDIYMVEVPVVNNKNADVGLWEVEIYDYVCDDDEHEWVGQLCGEHCDVCGTVKDPTLACEAEEDDGDCRTAVLCKYCDAVIVASKQHVFAKGETVCSNDGCVFEGKNITSSTTITPVDASDYPDAVNGVYYAGNGEYITWHYISSRICDGNYTTAVHSNYWGQYKFGFELNEATKLSEIFIVSNSSGTYHHWGYEFDNLTSDLAIKVIVYDADGNAIQTVEYQSLDFTNPNVVPIYAESGKMTSVAYKLDTNYATAKKVEVYINGGIFEVEIYEHVTCDYQFIETVAPGCTTSGYDIYRCDCGVEEQRNVVTALGHDYDDGVVTREATDLEDGEIVYTCATCGGTKTLAIPATGHEHNYDTHVETSLEPTCAAVGYATYQCRCGGTTEVEIPATGNHNYTVFVKYVEGKAPTYLYDGIGIYKCETCDDTDEIEVSRLIMNTVKYSEVSVPEGTCWVVGPKYLVDGNYMFGSGGSHSSNTYTINFVYGEDYYFDKIFIVTNSTGTQGTSDPWQNPFTSETMTTRAYYFTVSLLDENGSEVYSHRYHTSDCSLYVGVDSEGFEFDYQALTIEFEEACVAYSMSITVECKQNNSIGLWEVETYGLPVNYHEDHTYTVLLETTTASTCTTEGWGLYRCNRCEETQEHAIPTLAHTFNQEVGGTRIDSTCTEAGSVTMKCANCDTTEVQSIDAKGHTEVVDAAVAPTCTETGLTEGKHCDVCGEIIVAQETVDALGHTPSEDGAVCTVCNATLIAAYIGETPYATLEEAYAAANADDTITLIANIDLASTLYVNKKVTINLNGKTITATNDTVGDGVFCVLAGGELIIVGDGTVNGLANNPYSMAIWAKGGTVIIEGGTYTNVGASSDFDGEHFDLIYVSEGGYVEITGGTFTCETPEWTLNSKNSAPGTINVYGGTFTGFNPFANKDGECFLVAGYCSTEEANGTYTVGYYNDDNHTHYGVGEDDHIYVGSTCVSTGYETDKCYECGKKFYVLYGIDSEYGHDYLKEAVTGGYKYTCKLCGYSYTEITLGTSQDPIVAVIGENTVTIYVDGAEDVWYYLPVTEPGVYTVTVDSAEVGVKHAPDARALYRAQFTTGQTTYEIKVDPDNGSQYPIVFTSNIKSFTLSFEAKPYPVIVPGNNNVELEDGTDNWGSPITNNKVVFSTAGTFVLSFTEELTDVEVSVAYFHPMFGFTTEYVEFPYTLTVEEGQSAKIIINSYNPETKNVTINVACVEHSYNSVVTDPTCTEKGSVTYTCTVCGDTYTEEGEAALGHDYADATCVAPKTCKVCGATEGEALGHTEVIDAAVAPTCTETGLTEGKHCSVCNTVLVEQTVVDATGHNYKATENEDGSVTYTCDNCGNTYTVNNSLINGTYYYESINMFKAVFDGNGTVVIEETMGIGISGTYTYEYIINQQNVTIEDQTFFFTIDRQYNVAQLYLGTRPLPLSVYIPPVELELGDNAIDTNYTGKECTVTVAGKYTLKACEGEENAFVLLIDESGSSMITLPYEFEVAEGSAVKFLICTKEGEDEVNVNLHMHDFYYSYGDSVQSTCTNPGKEVYNCECGVSYEEVTAINPYYHPVEDGTYVIVESTCTSLGYEKYICADCGETIQTDYTEYGSHTFDENGDCTAEGCDFNGKGTVLAPITVETGDIEFFVVDGVGYTVYRIPVTYDYSKLVITVSDDVYVALGFSNWNVFEEVAETGKTTYEITLDAEKIYSETDVKYYQFAISTCETFNVAYTEEARPQLVEGPNAIVVPEIENMWGTSADTVIVVVKTPGSYILSLADGEENACVELGGDRLYLDEAAYEFTVDEGEVVKFSITTDNWSGDTIDLVLTVKAPAHVHTEVEIPAVLPTPSVDGYTAGIMCSECGETIKAPVKINVTELASNHAFRFRAASVSLDESISINYKPAKLDGYNNVYVVFVFEGVEYIVDTYDYVEPFSDGYRYSFKFSETGPELIASNIDAYCYAETADGFVMNKRLGYSIQAYLEGQLKANKAELTTVISNLLVMCSKAQLYMGENVDNLIYDVFVENGYKLTPTAFTSVDKSLNVQAITGDRTTGTDWKAGSLVMGASTEINFKFETDNLEGLKIKVVVGGDESTAKYFDPSELEKDGNRYVVNVNYLKSYEFNKVVTATFERDGVQVGSTVTYSVNSYLVNNHAKSTGNTKALIEALYVYGMSANSYFGK